MFSLPHLIKETPLLWGMHELSLKQLSGAINVKQNDQVVTLFRIEYQKSMEKLPEKDRKSQIFNHQKIYISKRFGIILSTQSHSSHQA